MFTYQTHSSSQDHKARPVPSSSAGCSSSLLYTACTPSHWSVDQLPQTCPRGRAQRHQPCQVGSRTLEGRVPPWIPTCSRTLPGTNRRLQPQWSSCRWQVGRVLEMLILLDSSDQLDTHPQLFHLESKNTMAGIVA